jgi:hypothetical protein
MTGTSRAFCAGREAGEVVDEQRRVNRFDGERDPRLVVDQDQD